MTSDLAANFRAIEQRLTVLERSMRLPTQRFAAAHNPIPTFFTPTLDSYDDFDGAASLTVDVPPTGSLAVWLAAQPVIEAPSGFYLLYLAPAMTGSNEISADYMPALMFAEGGIYPRPVWFTSFVGLNPGPTTLTFRTSYQGTSPPTTTGFIDQVMMAAPIWDPPDPLTTGSWEHLVIPP